MNITKSVKIGAIDYKVIECNNPSEEDFNIDGQIVYHKQEIRLKDELAKEYKENIFLHEIVHGIFDFAGIEQNEDIINRFSNALYQVIKDNKEIFYKTNE